ncbi:uncharacterized protein LOC113218216 isoform X2 [Frankliniella occidentalis]|uniref:Uncharacterized protein LOC113218216 isoform X2 n=1 Tax=Frankliniella occidentalis TaxID=133901 RepID=A0A9C6WXC9_FRAOC|nr:uncharacterized protein LOC113218216 isoform X2 [Frankliniella occidentalis]
MACDLCTEHFDGAERAPKVLPCGHTACLQCLQRLQDSRCPTCRRNIDGPPEELPTNFLALTLLEERRLDSTPRGWCSDCRAAATPRCWEDHDVLPVKRALRRLLQGSLPQAAEQLQGLPDQCRDEQALPALTLLTGESWDVSLRGGGRELTGTLRNTEDPLTKALWLLLAARAALTEVMKDPLRAAPPAAPPTAAPAAFLGLPPPATARPPRVMDVSIISRYRPDFMKQEKFVALLDARGVTRLVDVYCNVDPAWSLELLQIAAPSVEQLSVRNPLSGVHNYFHMLAVRAMPRLRRLEVICEGFLGLPAIVFNAPPPGHAGLQWLRVDRMFRSELQFMLRHNAHSLETLQMLMGTSRMGPDPQPELELNGLRALRRLVHNRIDGGHSADDCKLQLAEVRRRVLPGVEVFCDACDIGVKELF